MIIIYNSHDMRLDISCAAAWRRSAKQRWVAVGRLADDNRRKGMYSTDAGHTFLTVRLARVWSHMSDNGVSKGVPFGTRPCLQGLVCYACPLTGGKIRVAAIWAATRIRATGKRGGIFERSARNSRLVFSEEDGHTALVSRPRLHWLINLNNHELQRFLMLY